MDDEFHLQRFVGAQNTRHAYNDALAELRLGQKRSHWMWFVFPQIAGLGSSEQAQRFAISGLREAQSYLAHPVLGPRLRECARLLTELAATNANSVLGGDAMKLRSSMTLFARAAPHEQVFCDVLKQFFDDEPDRVTINLLAAATQRG